MTRIIMHGCNGHMGQVITGIVANDANAQIVAGIDLRDDGHNLYPVFASLEECNVEADVIIDFASAKAEDTLVDYIKKTKIPAVICTTGLSDEQIASINEASKSVAILRSANMSLGINTLFKLLQDAAKVFASAGFDIEIVEKLLSLTMPNIILRVRIILCICRNMKNLWRFFILIRRTHLSMYTAYSLMKSFAGKA